MLDNMLAELLVLLLYCLSFIEASCHEDFESFLSEKDNSPLDVDNLWAHQS